MLCRYTVVERYQIESLLKEIIDDFFKSGGDKISVSSTT